MVTIAMPKTKTILAVRGRKLDPLNTFNQMLGLPGLKGLLCRSIKVGLQISNAHRVLPRYFLPDIFSDSNIFFTHALTSVHGGPYPKFPRAHLCELTG
eukprot:9498394-Pyramimonas_sp.AAC.1